MITHNLKPFIDSLPDIAKKQIPFAASRALNVTMRDASTDITAQILAKLSVKRESYFRRAWKITNSTKSNLIVSIELRQDAPAKGTPYFDVLSQHFDGGDRHQKRFEKALSYFRGPTKTVVANDQSLSQSKYSQLLSYFDLSYKAGFTSKMKQKTKDQIANKKRNKSGYITYAGKRYFMLTDKKNGLIPGIYESTGVHGAMIKPVLIFSKSNTMHYKKVFDLHKMTERYFDKNFERNFLQELSNAIQTAK